MPRPADPPATRQPPSDALVERGLAAGANRYLTKPFDPDELLAIAHEVLGTA